MPFEISLHPIDVDFDYMPDHDDGEDHHHTFDTRVDWHLRRTQSRSILTLAKLIYIVQYNIEGPNNNPLIDRIVTEKPIKCQFIPVDPFEIRGPPISA